MAKAKEVRNFLPPDEGVNDVVNIDFYYVTFTRPQNKTLAEVFKDIRLQFGDFARGARADFDFQPYGKFFDLEGYAAKQKKLWESADPTGALMSFKLDTIRPKTVLATIANYIKIVQPWGDVQVTCASDADLIFSTVESVRGWTHPVAGNRGFGIRDAGDGNWMFYSKAVDRESKSVFNKAPGKGVFCYGHLFWLDFYANVKDYLNKQGMTVQKVAYDNHGTTWWPFRSGAPPKQAPCR